MIALKLALDLATLEQPPLAALRSASELGVEGVVIDARGDFALMRLSQTGIRQLRKTLADSRLRAAAVRFRTRRGYADPADLDARIEATKKALQLAYALGATVVLNHVGRVPGPDSTEWNTLREVLNDLGRFGHHAGAFLAAETGDDSPADLARLLAALETAALGVDLDPGALVLAGHSPQDAVEAIGSAVLHVHLTDARRDSFGGRGRFVPPGEGSADLAAVLSALEAHDYRGWMTLRPTEGDNPIEQAAAALRSLRKL